jgi:hypothetical protein
MWARDCDFQRKRHCFLPENCNFAGIIVKTDINMITKKLFLTAFAVSIVGLSISAQTGDAPVVQSSKSVSVLGDSYSTYEGFLTPVTNEVWYYAKANPKNTDVTSVTQTWWHEVISEMGWRLCVNNSYSGSTIGYLGYNGNDYSLRSFNTRMDQLGCPDIIFIFGATNDSWAHSPIGEYKYDDITTDDLWSFRPAMAKMLAWMKEHYAQSDIYFLLNDGLSADINTSVKTICEHYDVKRIELKQRDKMGGHATVKGMQQIANQVAEAM